MATASSASKEKSVFVTAVAWVLILFSSGFLFTGGLRYLIGEPVMPSGMFESVAQQPWMKQEPWILKLVFDHPEILVLSWCSIWLICGIGLAYRKEWARVLVSWMMLLAIAQTIAFAILEMPTFATIPDTFGFAQAALSVVVTLISSTIASCLYGFVGWKLRTEKIRAEFSGAARHT